MLEETSLLLDGHGVNEGLVPVSEVAREPSRRLCNSFRGPLTVGQVHVWKGPALGGSWVRERSKCEQQQRAHPYFTEGSLSMGILEGRRGGGNVERR
jgi:hypothetical protein